MKSTADILKEFDKEFGTPTSLGFGTWKKDDTGLPPAYHRVKAFLTQAMQDFALEVIGETEDSWTVQDHGFTKTFDSADLAHHDVKVRNELRMYQRALVKKLMNE